MPLNSAMGLGFLFTAQNLGAATFKSVQRDLQRTAAVSDLAAAKIDKSMSLIKGGALMAGAGAIGLVAGFKLAGAAGEFERGVAGVGAITRATAEDLKKLEEAAIQAGIKTQFSPTEAVEGLTNLGQAGLNATDSISALIPTLDMAAGSLGQLGVADAAGLAVQAMKGFGIEAKDVGFAMDRMLRTTNSFNIAAGELPLAFGIGARGALALNASLDDTAISLGLAKNVMPSVERASTSVAVAMERLARKQGQQALATEFGVKAVDKATGKFRPFLDVIIDMIDKSKKMTEAQRSNALATIFGARAGGGVVAILKQLTDGVKTNTGEILKGRDAVEYYRKEMKGAAGAAGEFSGALLNTFAGQKILLQGTLQTLAIVLGKPFARILKPFVKLITDSLNMVIKIIQKIPDPLQDAIGMIVMLGSAFLTIAGGAALLKGALGLLGVTFAGLAKLLWGAVVAAWPVVLVIGAVTAAIMFLSWAWEKNLGGMRDFGMRVFEKIKLFYRAMVQLFTQGGFSGAVRNELNLSYNQGFKKFVIDIYVAIRRIQVFFSEFASEAGKGLQYLQPLFEELVGFLEELGGLFGYTAKTAEENARAYDRAASAGATLGAVVRDLMMVIGWFGSTTFKGLSLITQTLRGQLIDWSEIWLQMKVMAWEFSAEIIRAVFSMAKGITKGIESISPTLAEKMGFSPAAAVAEAERDLLRMTAREMGVTARVALAPEGEVSPERTRALTAKIGRQTGFTPTAAETKIIAARLESAQQAGWTDEQIEKLAAQIAAEHRPVVVTIDGEVVAQATSRASRRIAARSFAEVPTGD